MTNEEIVKEIQRGHMEYMTVLWEQVKNFCGKAAWRLYITLDGKKNGIELDDLKQSAYIAVYNAAQAYEDRGKSFIGFLAEYSLKSEFARCCGYRTSKRDALMYAKSLDAPIDERDPDGNTLLDAISDEKDDGTDFTEAVEDQICNEELHSILDELMETLLESEAACIRDYYYNSMSQKDIAEKNHTSIESVSKKHRMGILKMRKSAMSTEAGRKLREYMNDVTPWYTKVGVNAFNTSGTSAVELITFKREALLKSAMKGNYYGYN